MSALDEIMGQVNDYARAWADAQTAEMGDRINAYAYRAEERAALRTLIAASLADARREGAEQMREASGDAAQTAAGKGLSASAVHPRPAPADRPAPGGAARSKPDETLTPDATKPRPQ